MRHFVIALIALCMCSCTAAFEEDSVNASGDYIIMTVSHEPVYMRYGPDGDGPAQCILVMDEDYPGEWRPLLCGDIEGFEYEPGVEYTLCVHRTFVPEGIASYAEYRLIEILHSETVGE